MDFGILIPPVADSWKLAKRAEELGFARAWFYDTQMLNAELFVSMTAAALNTNTIRLASVWTNGRKCFMMCDNSTTEDSPAC